jgi:hypothetical protein
MVDVQGLVVRSLLQRVVPLEDEIATFLTTPASQAPAS